MANVKVNIDVDSGQVEIASTRTLTLTEQVRVLRKELQKVPEGTAEWTLLQQKFNETKDALDRVNVKSKELFGTLGALPGQFGTISSQVDSSIGVLKTFSKITFSDIKSQVVALGNDFKDIFVNLGKLTGITALYTTLNNALASSFVAVGVGEEAAAVGAKTFAAALTATGVGAIIVGVGLLVNKLMDLYDAYTNAGKKVQEFDEILQKSVEEGKTMADIYGKNEELKAKAAGKSDAEVVKIKQETLRKQIEFDKAALASVENSRQEEYRIANRFMSMTDEEKRVIDKKYNEEKSKLELDILQKTKESENAGLEIKIKALEEKKKKDEQAADKAKSLRDKELDEIKKNQIAASEAMLEGRAKDLKVVDDKYAAQIALAKKYHKDTTQLEAAQKQERKVINDKYDEQEAKAASDFAKKLGAIHIAAIINDLQQKKAEREEKYNQDLRDLEKDKEFIKLSEDAKNVYRKELRAAADQDQLEMDDKASQDVFDRKLKALAVENEGLIKGTKSYFDNKKEIINVSEANEINDARVAMDQKLITEDEFEKAKTDIQAKYAQQRKDVAKSELDTYLGYASTVLGAINGIFSQASSVLKMQQDQDLQNAAGNAEEIDKLKRKHFEENKKMQIAQAIIGTLQSAVQAFQSLAVIPVVGPVLGAAAAAAALVFGYKQVALIRAQTYQSDSSSASSASSVGTSSSAGTGFALPSIGAPQIGATSAQEGTIAGIAAGSMAANNSAGRPLRAYVVGNDITSEMQLQRRIKAAARLGG
jgi:hypothetical protein